MTEIGPRIYSPETLRPGGQVTLTGDPHRHLAHVLRLKAGAAVTLFDGNGGEYAAVIEAIDRRTATLRTGEFRDVSNESPLPILLAQGIGRGERTDYAIQKAVELGVSIIVPLLTRRGVVRLDADRAQRRLAHWRGIVVHACQQCGRTRLAQLCPVISLYDWLRDYPGGGLDLVLDPDNTTAIDNLKYAGGPISLLVGPEGGLDKEEYKAAYAAGFVGVSLGPRTLRTETAALAGLTAVQLRWGDLS